MQAVLRDLPPVGHIGRYAVLGKLATGGMAEIFLARADMAHGAWRLVVLKRILAHVADDPEHVSAFVQEARLSLRLQHPNICTVYEVGEDRGRTFLVMEYVDGVRLSDLVDLTGALPAPLAARIVADVAAALEHAHGLVGEDGEPLGIVHRDVTPDNIMLGFDGRVKLLDFGIAKARTQSRLTQAGVLKGKVAYMSPEQYRGEALDGRSDVFALGACFYEALTGKSAFDRGTDAQTVAAILFDDAPLSPHAVRPEVPEALDDLVRGAVARSQERRPSAGALLRELEAWLDGRPAKTTERDIAALLEATFDQSPPELDRTPLDAAPRLDAATTAAVRAELDDVVESMRARSRRQRALLVLIALVVVVAAGSAVAWKLTMAPPPDGPGAQDAPDEPSDTP